MSTSFCPFCGKPTSSGSAFCAACGKALTPAPAARSAPSAAGGATATRAATASGAASASARVAAVSQPEEEVFLLKPLVVRTLFEIVLSVLTLGIAWIFLWIARMGRRYRITTQRIETRHGVVTIRRDYTDLFRVEDFEIVEPFFLRMRGAGHLRIWTMDKDAPVLVLEAIPNVKEVYETLRTLTREERARNQVRVIEGS